jgi:molecular chaperone GrpE
MDDKKEQPGFQVADRRFWVNDEEAVERASAPQERYPSYVEELKARTEKAEQRLLEKSRALEQENQAYRERLSREIGRRLEGEKLELLESLLEIVDNFERALRAAEQAASAENGTVALAKLTEGVRLNLDLLLARLRSEGVEPIDPTGLFDPYFAEAVGTVIVTDPAQDQSVMDVVQKGYRYREQLLRPARVRVGHFEEGEKG